LQNKERRRRKTFLEFEECYKNSIPYELQMKKDIECYDKVMESHTNYLNILYNLALVYKQRLRKIYLAKIKRDS
jgi:hypothetical protein